MFKMSGLTINNFILIEMVGLIGGKTFYAKFSTEMKGSFGEILTDVFVGTRQTNPDLVL